MCKETRCIFEPILTYGLTFLMSAKIVSAWVKKAKHAETNKINKLAYQVFFFLHDLFFLPGANTMHMHTQKNNARGL